MLSEILGQPGSPAALLGVFLSNWCFPFPRFRSGDFEIQFPWEVPSCNARCGPSKLLIRW